jgi:hypothetical protein
VLAGDRQRFADRRVANVMHQPFDPVTLPTQVVKILGWHESGIPPLGNGGVNHFYLEISEMRSKLFAEMNVDREIRAHGSAVPFGDDLQDLPFHPLNIERLFFMFGMVINYDRLNHTDSIANFHTLSG